MLLTLALALVLQKPVPDSAAQASAYLDPGARVLVSRARARREVSDRSIRAYRVTMKERIGLGIRALRRDRMLYRREITLHVDWRRDTTSRIDVVGAREGVPAAFTKVQVPEDLKGDVPDYAFDPADDQLQVGSGRDRADSSDHKRSGSVTVRHPISPGSEADYRFQS